MVTVRNFTKQLKGYNSLVSIWIF